eukprot:365456-Chlamydomonas_euryale.AAC.18
MGRTLCPEHVPGAERCALNMFQGPNAVPSASAALVYRLRWPWKAQGVRSTGLVCTVTDN